MRLYYSLTTRQEIPKFLNFANVQYEKLFLLKHAARSSIKKSGVFIQLKPYKDIMIVTGSDT